MKLRIHVLLALAVLLAAAGCGTLDIAPGGDPDRVLTGAVNVGTALPPGAEVIVRLLGPSTTVAEPPRASGADTPVVARPVADRAERVLGEHRQTLANGTTEPVPFRIAYLADDTALRRGLTLEARVSYGGRLRYRTISAHVVTLASSAYPQEVVLQAVQ